LLILFP